MAQTGNERIIHLGTSHLNRPKSYNLESGETSISGIGTDFVQRPQMALRYFY